MSIAIIAVDVHRYVQIKPRIIAASNLVTRPGTEQFIPLLRLSYSSSVHTSGGSEKHPSPTMIGSHHHRYAWCFPRPRSSVTQRRIKAHYVRKWHNYKLECFHDTDIGFQGQMSCLLLACTHFDSKSPKLRQMLCKAIKVSRRGTHKIVGSLGNLDDNKSFGMLGSLNNSIANTLRHLANVNELHCIGIAAAASP